MSGLQAEQDPEPVTHLILILGDGMDLEHEIAASGYLYGEPDRLAWHSDSLFRFRGWCTTWDVDTYNRYAREAGAPTYDREDFDPDLGYSVSRGGIRPLEGFEEYFLTPLP